jgi:hypothetical protein
MGKNPQRVSRTTDGGKDAVVKLDKHSEEAIHQAISQSIVGVIGRDGRGRVGQIGTGTLVQIGTRRCILTAKHDIERWTVADLRFFLPLPVRGFRQAYPPPSVSVEEYKAWQAVDVGSAYCDDGLDLVVLEFSRHAKLDSSCVFREIGPLRRKLPSGSVFAMVGFPKATTRGLSEHVAAIYSSVERPVLVVPDLTLTGYDPSVHMFVTSPRPPTTSRMAIVKRASGATRTSKRACGVQPLCLWGWCWNIIRIDN